MSMYRFHDPGRGPFEVVQKDPIQDREINPRGTRHINKTAQDHMPVDKRPRVQEWQRQLEKRRQGR